jgi:hypothetical protein
MTENFLIQIIRLAKSPFPFNRLSKHNTRAGINF